MKKRILALLTAGTMLLAGCGAQGAAQDSAAADKLREYLARTGGQG